ETMDLVTSESGEYDSLNVGQPDQKQEKPMQATAPSHQKEPTYTTRPLPGAFSVASVAGEPYRFSIAGGRLQGTFDLTNPADADEMIRAINACKVLLKPSEK